MTPAPIVDSTATINKKFQSAPTNNRHCACGEARLQRRDLRRMQKGSEFRQLPRFDRDVCALTRNLKFTDELFDSGILSEEAIHCVQGIVPGMDVTMLEKVM